MLDNIERLKILADMSTDTAAEICNDAIEHIKAIEESLKVSQERCLAQKTELTQACEIVTDQNKEITRLEEAVKERDGQIVKIAEQLKILRDD